MQQIQYNKILSTWKYFGLRKVYWVLLKISESFTDFLIDNNIINSNLSQVLIKRHISRQLIQNYGGDEGHNLNFTQFNLGFGLIHYAFIRNIRPNNILCVGSRNGFIPAILAIACKDNNMGHVDFVDAGYDRENKNNWGGIGFWKKNDPIKHFSKLHISKYISIHVMTTQQFSNTHKNIKYQYIYIDGDHSYKGVLLDYSLFWPRLTKHGFMIFHDVSVQWTKNHGYFGVWKLWKKLLNKHKIIFPFPKESGLGIIQK